MDAENLHMGNRVLIIDMGPSRLMIGFLIPSNSSEICVKLDFITCKLEMWTRVDRLRLETFYSFDLDSTWRWRTATRIRFATWHIWTRMRLESFYCLDLDSWTRLEDEEQELGLDLQLDIFFFYSWRWWLRFDLKLVIKDLNASSV